MQRIVFEEISQWFFFYAPPEGETRGARCEASIRKVMRARRKVKMRDLRKLSNAHRFGLSLWEKALKDLTQSGEVRIAEGDRKGSKICILLKLKDLRRFDGGLTAL